MRSPFSRARRQSLQFGGFRDGYFPSEHAAIKEYFERLKQLPVPDLIFTHERVDLHQDHRIAMRARLEHIPQPRDSGIREIVL